MQTWNITPEKPIALTLSADHRFSSIDYLNDQIWELKLGNVDPPSMSLETTFGLRARLCRIFPRFLMNEKVVTNPVDFSHPIIIRRYFPNYLELAFKIFTHINVKLEYWVPTSQSIAGRIKLINNGHEACSLQMEWAEILLSSEDGFRMTLSEIGLTTLLTGKTSNISPVLFLTGGAQPGKSPYPSLNLELSIPARSEKEAHWVHAALPELDASYTLAKELSNKNWDAEFAHIERVNSSSIQIHTGNKSWDTAFLISQTLSNQLFVRSKRLDASSSIVITRKPDQGYSVIGDGSDYNHLWNGQTSLDSYYFMNFLLPESPQLLKNLLNNYLDSQLPSGEIDLKPGFAGQRSHILATPVLSFIAYCLYEVDGDLEYLKLIFPKLVAFTLSWFSPAHDRDGDQIPEWDQPVQTGLEDLPFYSQHSPSIIGIDISSVESPDLASYLYQECKTLIRISNLISEQDIAKPFEALAEKLLLMVEHTWSEEIACYQYQDRDSHINSSGDLLGELRGAGTIEIHKEFLLPIRPFIHLESKNEITQSCQIFIHGTGRTGTHRVENISSTKIRRNGRHGYTTSDYNYLSIEHIEVNGISSDIVISAYTINLQQVDLSLAIPLWAGIPSKERAKILINLTVMNKKKFLSPHGLKTHISSATDKEDDILDNGTYLPLTALILEGFVRYDERDKAAEIFQRLMIGVVDSFQSGLSLYQFHHPETGKPFGPQNSLSSLIPISLFLKILGIKIFTPYKLEVAGKNPFPWPVTVKYQGLTVVKQEKKSFIVFPDGHSITIDNTESQLISREIQPKALL